jgi:hypothetical protein
MSTTVSRTGRHIHMRPVVRPLPRPAMALSTGTTW